MSELRLTTVTLNAPDPRALADFYGRLLGWTIGADEPDWVTLRPPEPGVVLGFHLEPNHVPPVWPGRPDEQQMQVHLEIRVDGGTDELAAAVEHATECGARVADLQPQEDVRVCLDPVGHPFCLWIDS